MLNRNLTMRIDDNKKAILESLSEETSISKSEIIRQSLQLLADFLDVKKQCGEIRMKVGQDEMLLLLL